MHKIKTDSSILFETQKKNKYFFDRKLKKTILCHPLFYFLLKLKKEGIEPVDWVNQLQEDRVQIEGYGIFTREEVAYYLKKFLILKENGYFGELPQEDRLNVRMTPEKVKTALANTPQVTFEVTDRCSLICAYCGYGKFYGDYDQRANKDMDIAVAKRMLRELQTLWNSPLNNSHDRNIYISYYGGEPLLNFPFIRESVDYVKKLKLLHNRFSFSMTTNGLLVEKYMDFLAANNFYLLISLDGNESNNQYRVLKSGKSSFQGILKNVRALQRKYPDYFHNKVNFNAILHNKNSVSEIYRFFKENFDKSPRIAELNTSGIKEDQKESFLETYANVTESLFKSENYKAIEKEMFIKLPSIQQISTFLHKNNDFAFEDYNELKYITDNQMKYPSGTCIPFSKKLFLTVNGKILACERIGQQYVLGYVTPQTVDIDYEKISENYNAWYDKIIKLCSSCYKIDDCSQCIFNLDLTAQHPNCHGFLNCKDYSHYIASYLDVIENEPKLYTKILKEVLFN